VVDLDANKLGSQPKVMFKLFGDIVLKQYIIFHSVLQCSAALEPCREDERGTPLLS
jgi:hypothetical protein